jgi:5-aminopentanamidase
MTRIACCQIAPVIGQPDVNTGLILDQIRTAVAAGADVIVLPELATSGYMFADAEEARALALPAAAEPFTAWIEAAGDAIVIGGFPELGADGLLYNSAVMLDGSGVLGFYRKSHLWDREKLVFTPGAEAPRVLATRHGAIAVMICYDLEFPELTRPVALAGAELIAAPVNWPLFPRPDGEHPGEVINAMATARASKVAVACCDRSGVERGQPWTAGSAVISPDGWVLDTAGPDAGLAIAEIDLRVTHDKSLTEHVDLFGDRRPELY